MPCPAVYTSSETYHTAPPNTPDPAKIWMQKGVIGYIASLYFQFYSEKHMEMFVSNHEKAWLDSHPAFYLATMRAIKGRLGWWFGFLRNYLFFASWITIMSILWAFAVFSCKLEFWVAMHEIISFPELDPGWLAAVPGACFKLGNLVWAEVQIRSESMVWKALVDGDWLL